MKDKIIFLIIFLSINLFLIGLSKAQDQFSFNVSVNDVVRMGSDANAVGDELMTVVSVASSGVAGETIEMGRGSCNTTTSLHSVGDGAFLLQNLSDPIYLIDNLTTALIYYPSHGLASGDFINFFDLNWAFLLVSIL